jgi:hypothetical protein
MKPIKFSKKLSLNKKTIVNLNKNAMIEVFGGGIPRREVTDPIDCPTQCTNCTCTCGSLPDVCICGVSTA